MLFKKTNVQIRKKIEKMKIINKAKKQRKYNPNAPEKYRYNQCKLLLVMNIYYSNIA